MKNLHDYKITGAGKKKLDSPKALSMPSKLAMPRG